MNNYDVINKLNNVLKDLESISSYILKLEKETRVFIDELEGKIITDTERIDTSNNDIKMIRIINKYIRENGNTLDKDHQSKLFKKIAWCNDEKLSLIKVLRNLNYNFKYIDTEEEWKDIYINEKVIL